MANKPATTNTTPTKRKTMATNKANQQAAAQAAEDQAAQAAQAAVAQAEPDEQDEQDEQDDAQLGEGAVLTAGNWYPVTLTKAIRYQFAGAKSAVRVKIGTYPAFLPLLPDWCTVVANADGEIEEVNPLAFSQDGQGKIVYQDKTAQAIFLTAQNAVKQAASLACKVVDVETGKALKAKQYKDEAELLAACKLVAPTDLADSWEAWLATADRGGYARSCQDYTALLVAIRKALAASGISSAGVENTCRWFDLPGSMFSTSDKARLVDAFCAYPTKNPLSDDKRKEAQDKTLARMAEQAELHSEAHPAGVAMLSGFLDSIRAKLAAPTAAVEDDTALD